MALDTNTQNAVTGAGDSPVYPLFPPDFFNANKVSFEYIVLVVLTTMGIGSVEFDMYQKSQAQPDADKVRSDLFELMNFITEWQNNAGSSGNISQADVEKFLNLLKKLFGQGGDLDTLKADLAKMGIKDDSVVQLLENIKDEIGNAFADSDNSEKGASFEKITNFWNQIQNGGSNGNWDPTFVSNVQTDLDKFQMNSYYASNPGSTPSGWSGANWFNTFYSSGQSGQSGLQGLSSEFAAGIQQDTSELTSYQQTGQQILQSANQFKTNSVNDEKTQ